jgi:hypothetical protein
MIFNFIRADNVLFPRDDHRTKLRFMEELFQIDEELALFNNIHSLFTSQF